MTTRFVKTTSTGSDVAVLEGQLVKRAGEFSVAPVGYSFTSEEGEAFDRGETISWSKEVAAERKVLCNDLIEDLDIFLDRFAGKNVKILVVEVEPELTDKDGT